MFRNFARTGSSSRETAQNSEFLGRMGGIPSNVKDGIRSNVNNPINMGPSNVNISSRTNPGPNNVNNPSNQGNSNTANTPNSPNTAEVARELIGGRYVVMPGDSVGRIALRFGTNVAMLVTLNRSVVVT